MDPLTFGLIMGGSALLSSGVQAGGNLLSTNAANEANKELWREQTQYNLPERQIQRLKAAGLNPHLAYGKGINANIATEAPTMRAAEIPNPHLELAAGQQVMNQDLTRKTMAANLKEAEAAANIAKRNADTQASIDDNFGVNVGWAGNTPAGQVAIGAEAARRAAIKLKNTIETQDRTRVIPSESERHESFYIPRGLNVH